MMEKPSGAFFETLGQYVYAYVDPDSGEWYYVGKGNSDRCWSHVESKGFDPDHIHIVAKDLDRFFEKSDWQSFLLESYLIATIKPAHNSVAGHYQECFEMASLSSYFESYQAEQHDNFEAFPEWYVENYDIIRGNVGSLIINGNSFFFKSNAKNTLYMSWSYLPTSTEPVRVQIEISNRLNETKFAEMRKGVVNFLTDEGYDPQDETEKGTKTKLVTVYCDDMDEVIELFRKFVS